MICATIIKGLNEREMNKLLNFALQNPNVESIYFNDARLLGRIASDVEKEISLAKDFICLSFGFLNGIPEI